MESEPPSFKETQFLDKHAKKKNQKELPLLAANAIPKSRLGAAQHLRAWGAAVVRADTLNGDSKAPVY